MVRVIIADDHVLIREGFRKLLAREPDMEVVGEAVDCPGLLSLVESIPADIVLMDVNMPGDPLETLRRVPLVRAGVPVLVVSIVPEEHIGPPFLRMGAAGYVSKQAAADELIGAVRKVLAGGRYIGPALAERLAFRGGKALLSPRELEVLRLIAGGRPVKDIAGDLSVSVSTVHTHRARVFEKLNLRSDVDLARYAVHNRLVD